MAVLLPRYFSMTFTEWLIMHRYAITLPNSDVIDNQSHILAVDLVSDPPTQQSTPSRGAEPSSDSATSLILDQLHGTVFHTISIKSLTLVFSSTASKLNYFVEHKSLVLVSAHGRSINSAIQI